MTLKSEMKLLERTIYEERKIYTEKFFNVFTISFGNWKIERLRIIQFYLERTDVDIQYS